MSPEGVELTRKGSRSPLMTFRSVKGATNAMDLYLIDYEPRGESSNPVPQDFDSLRQAINIASADQRPLVLISTKEANTKNAKELIGSIAFDEDIVGRFHFDFASNPSEWDKKLVDANGKTITFLKEGIHILYADEFGLKAKLVKTLSPKIKPQNLKNVLISANKHFAKVTPVKNYNDHVRKGKALGIVFDMAMPYGEDRDGDGIIDRRGGIGRQRR